MHPAKTDEAVVRELPLRKRDRERLAKGELAFRTLPGRLFAQPPRHTDCRQGFIGDCYLLSALSALARAAPQRLRELIRERPDGSYAARFFRRLPGGQFQAEEVAFDGSVPVFSKTGEPVYVRAAPRDGEPELWPMLVEKAYAVWKGGYDVMGEGGMVEQTLEELTGQPTRMLFTAEAEPEQLWRLMERATREGWPGCVCTAGRHERPGVDELGFHPNHIVILLGVHTWMGRRIVWLRDPFDTPATGKLALPDPDGVYTLHWEDFLAYFAEVQLCGTDALKVALPPHPKRTLLDALAQSYAFGWLPAATRKALAKDFKRTVFAPGELLQRIGDPPDHFDLVEYGSAVVEWRKPGSTRMKRLVVLRAGDQSGDMAVIDDMDHTVQVRALTEVAAYRMSAEKLRAWIKRHPELEARFRRRMDLRRTMQTWRKRDLTALGADELLRAGKLRNLAAGKVLNREGDAPGPMYLVVRGELEVRRGRKALRVRPGGVLGEVDVLRHRPRLGTASARGKAQVLELDYGAAREALEKFDVIQRQLEAVIERRDKLSRNQVRSS